MLDAQRVPESDGSDHVAPVLDPASLDQLRALDPKGSGFLQRVLTTFQRSLATQSDGVTEALARQDWTALSHAAHALKSAAASVGALGLSRLCAGLEESVREGRTDGVPEQVALFVREVARVREAVAALLSTGAP